MPARPEGAKWIEAPRIVESLTYRADRQGFIEQGLNQIFIVPAEGGTERRVTDGQYNYARRVLFHERRQGDPVFRRPRSELGA